jgi:hypothetical protein
MNKLRGVVTRVIFHVEYPDGSKKTSEYVPTDRLNAVLLSEHYMSEEAKRLFNVSTSDWKKNPAMVIADGHRLIPNCDYPDCQPA